MTWIDHSVVLLGAALLIWLSVKDVAKVGRHYPFPESERIINCGYYAMSQWFSWGGVHIGVSHNGLAIRQAIIPWLVHVRAFVPWEDTWMREHGDKVAIGFSEVPGFEMRLNRVVVATMQHRLRRKVPFGHVERMPI
jgi:hypothetical protein